MTLVAETYILLHLACGKGKGCDYSVTRVAEAYISWLPRLTCRYIWPVVKGRVYYSVTLVPEAYISLHLACNKGKSLL